MASAPVGPCTSENTYYRNIFAGQLDCLYRAEGTG